MWGQRGFSSQAPVHRVFPKALPAPAQAQPEAQPSRPETATFHFGPHALRVVMLEGNPWFVAQDVCHALNAYIRANGSAHTASATRTLAEDEMFTLSYEKGKRIALNVPRRGLSLVSESGFYKMVSRSATFRSALCATSSRAASPP